MPNDFSYVVWEQTQQRSVIPNTSVQGTIMDGSKVKAKWRGRLYDATIIKTGSDKAALMKLLKPNSKKRTTKIIARGQKNKTKQATAKQFLDNEIMAANEEEDDDSIFEVPPLPPPLHFNMPPLPSSSNQLPSNPPVSSVPSSNPPVSSVPSSNPPVSSVTSSNSPVSSVPSSNPPVSSVPSSNPPVSSVPSSNPPVSSVPSSNPPVSSVPPRFRSNPPVSSVPSRFPSNPPVSSVPPRFPSNTPVSTNTYPLMSYTQYNYQPSSLATNYPPLSGNCYDLQFANYRLDEVEKQLSFFEERITHLEGLISANTSFTEETNTSTSTCIPGITREKMTVVNMILSNKTIGWQAALRKILVAVVGIEELAQSCAKGKKNAQNKSLDPQVVRSITDILYQRYGESFRPEAINTVINSACSGARRALKDCPPCP